MADCVKNREWISVLLDGELSGDDERALRAHLEACAACRRVFEAYQAVSETLSEDLAEPPEQLKYGVMLRIAAAEETKKRNRRLYRPMRIAALAACTALILYAGYRLDLRNKLHADVSTQAAAFAGGAAEAASREGAADAPQVFYSADSSAKNREEARDRSVEEPAASAAAVPEEPAAGANEQSVQDGTAGPMYMAPPTPSPAAPPASESEADGTGSGGGYDGLTMTGRQECSYSHVLIRAGDSTLLESGDPALLLTLTCEILIPGESSGAAPDREADYTVELTRDDVQESCVCLVWVMDDALWWRAEDAGEATRSPAPASAFLELLPPVESG